MNYLEVKKNTDYYYNNISNACESYVLDKSKALISWMNTSNKSNQVAIGIIGCGAALILEASLLHITGYDESYLSIFHQGFADYSSKMAELSPLISFLAVLPPLVLTSIAIPFSEEVFFRDIIQKKLFHPLKSFEENQSKWSLASKIARIGGTAGLFALSHIGMTNTHQDLVCHLLSTLGMGISFSLLSEYSGLFSSCIAHSLRNFLPAAIFQSIHNSTPTAPLLQLSSAIILSTILMKSAEKFIKKTANKIQENPTDYLQSCKIIINKLEKLKKEIEINLEKLDLSEEKVSENRKKINKIEKSIKCLGKNSIANPIALATSIIHIGSANKSLSPTKQEHLRDGKKVIIRVHQLPPDYNACLSQITKTINSFQILLETFEVLIKN